VSNAATAVAAPADDPTIPVAFILQWVDHGILTVEWASPIIAATQVKADWLRSLQFTEYVAVLPVYRAGYERAKARIGEHFVGFNHIEEGRRHHGEKFRGRTAKAATVRNT